MNYLLSVGRAVIIPTIRVVIIKYRSFRMLISESSTASKTKKLLLVKLLKHLNS